jgi:hypothetical protein
MLTLLMSKLINIFLTNGFLQNFFVMANLVKRKCNKNNLCELNFTFKKIIFTFAKTLMLKNHGKCKCYQKNKRNKN